MARRIEAAACGRTSSAVIDDDATLWVAGANLWGQLGVGDDGDRGHFVPVPGVAAAQVAVGLHHMAVIDRAGQLWTAGRNDHGQLGLPGRQQRVHLTRIEGIQATKVACGDAHTAIITPDGHLNVAGRNSAGQLGLGDHEKRSSFVDTGRRHVRDVACGQGHTAVLSRSGLVTAGSPAQGRLGRPVVQAAPAELFCPAASAPEEISMLACGPSSTVVLDGAGNPWRVGPMFGTTPDKNKKSPHSSYRFVRFGNRKLRSISIGHEFAVGVDDDATLWAMGENSNGQLGGLGYRVSAFVPVPTGPPAESVTCGFGNVLAVDVDGRLWASGLSRHGQLGCGTFDIAGFSRIEVGTASAEVAAQLRSEAVGVADAYEMSAAALV